MFKFEWQDPVNFEQSSAELKEGPASFKIIGYDYFDKNGYPLMSKDKKPMLKLKIQVTDQYNNKGNLYQYLVSSVAWKIHELAVSINMPQLYTPQGLDEKALVNAQGQCELKIKENPGYEPAIRINKFLPFNHQQAAENDDQLRQYHNFNDEIPF